MVKRACVCFWLWLLLYLTLSVVGVLSLMRRGQIFTPGTSYDWSTSGTEAVLNGDMVNTARSEVSKFGLDADSSRRRLAEILGADDGRIADDWNESDGAGVGRALEESGSGEVEVASPERSRGAGGLYTTQFLYFAKDRTKSVFTPAILKQMCEQENAILGLTDYGKVCKNSTGSSSIYSSTVDGNCTLPSYSAVSLYYLLWDKSVHSVYDVRAARDSVATAMDSIVRTNSETGYGPSVGAKAGWWGANTAKVSTLVNEINAATAAAKLLNPGGSYATAFDGLISGLEALAPNLAANGFALIGSGPSDTSTSTVFFLLNSVKTVLSYTADLSDIAINSAVIFSGMPLRGWPAGKPPEKGVDKISAFGSHTRTCQLLDPAYVEWRTNQIFEMAHASSATEALVGFFLTRDAMATNSSYATRSIIESGRPRAAPYESKDALEKWWDDRLPDVFTFFGMKGGFLNSAFRAKATTADLEVKFFNGVWYRDEFDNIITFDLSMVSAALLFVYVYICLHTATFTLGCLGILQIMLSVPLALFVYVVVLRVPYFAQVHILALFICLGVGADDLFVFMDAWRQSASVPGIRTLQERMRYTYERTFWAVFNTTFTTAIAFAATAAAPIMPIASFGIFASAAIVFNWLLTVTWWPCAVLMWELYFCKAHCIGCCFSCSGCPEKLPCFIDDQTTNPYTDPDGRRASISGRTQPEHAAAKKAGKAEQPDGPFDPSTARFTERFFHSVFAPALNWSIGKPICFGITFKPISVALVLSLGSVGAWLISEAATLTTPDKLPVWFPDNHMFTGFDDLQRDTYLSGDDDAYMTGSLYFGLKDVYAPDFSRWIPAENRGSIVWDENFDLSQADAQAALLDVCTDLRAEACDDLATGAQLDVCTRPPRNLLSADTLKCWLEDFDAHYNGTMPTGAAFADGVKTWLGHSNKRSLYGSDIGFINGTIKYTRLRFVYSALVGQPVAPLRQLFDRSKAFTTRRVLSAAPASLGERPFFHASGFAWMQTSEQLVTVVLQGFAIIFPCAFCILLYSTVSFLASAYATLTVALITGSLLGGVKVAFGFALGISESIAGSIVIGLSIDYTLHLLHAYVHSTAPTREGKMAHAATVMGVTVVAGAITTFFSSLFMVACQLTFFTQMCILLSGTIFFSLLYALFFFMPLLALIGPLGEHTTWYNRLTCTPVPGRSGAPATAEVVASTSSTDDAVSKQA